MAQRKKRLTQREKAERAALKKKWQAEGLIPPDKPRLNRKKFAREAWEAFDAFYRAEPIRAELSLLKAIGFMVGPDMKEVSPEEVGVLKFSFPGHRPKDLVTFQKINSSQMVHPTEKPVGLLANLITSVTKPGDLILDPFAGSGSTLVAAKKTGRRFIGVELDDDYYQIAQRRIEEAVE